MTLTVDQAAVSRHIRHLDAAYKAISFPWEISNIGAIEALHVVASRHDRKFAADLFRAMADRMEQYRSSPPPADRTSPRGMIDPDRLERAETMAGLMSGKMNIRLGENPPTDPLVISCLDMIGRGWIDGKRYRIGQEDVTNDLRFIYDEIQRITEPLCDDVTGEPLEEPDVDRESLRVIGARMNRIGGIHAMRLAVEMVKPMAGSKVSRLDWAWDGIGEWRW